MWTDYACNRAVNNNRHAELVSASPSEQIAQQVRNDSVCSLAPRGRGLGRGGQDERCHLSRGAVKPNAGKNDRHAELVSGSPLEQISQTCIETSSLAPRGRGLGRGGKTSNRQAAFTLAEVLITLGIIGVVAALTMPALITNIQDRIQAKRIENINQKLSKVTDKMAVQSGLTGYDTTMAFVQEMSKHMKIAKICDNEHLAECWPTQEVTLNDEGKTWEISKTKNAKTLKISNKPEDWADTVGIVTGDGTGMILSYNKKCEFNVDDVGLKYDNSTGKSNSLVCLSGVFDWNGSSKPNKLKKDVTTLGMATGLGSECAIELGGKCFTAAFTPTPLTRAQCLAEKDKLGIKECSDENDYWAGAVKQCGGVSKMPTMVQLGELASQMYVGNPSIGAKQNKYNIQYDPNSPVSKALGLTPEFLLYSGEVHDIYSYAVNVRQFSKTYSLWNSYSRDWSGRQAVCLGD